jgi:hypothetical protein
MFSEASGYSELHDVITLESILFLVRFLFDLFEGTTYTWVYAVNSILEHYCTVPCSAFILKQTQTNKNKLRDP